MLRAARFEAKLGFTTRRSERRADRRDCAACWPACRRRDCSMRPLKLFLTGHGARQPRVLRSARLVRGAVPGGRSLSRRASRQPGRSSCCVQGLRNTDERVEADKPVTPTFLFALLLYGPIAQIIESLPPQRWHELQRDRGGLRPGAARGAAARDDSAPHRTGRARDVRAAAAAGRAARAARAAPARAAALPCGVRSADAACRAGPGRARSGPVVDDAAGGHSSRTRTDCRSDARHALTILEPRCIDTGIRQRAAAAPPTAIARRGGGGNGGSSGGGASSGGANGGNATGGG